MSTIEKGREQEVIDSCLDHIKAGARGMSDWEVNFIESIANQFSSVGRLSERQLEILERIYTRI